METDRDSFREQRVTNIFDFNKDLGLKVNGNSDKEIKEGGGGDECVIHHWGPIPFTGRVSAFSVYHAPLNPNPLKTSIK